MTFQEKRKIKKVLSNLTPQEKSFINVMNNYVLLLCVRKDKESIKELNEIIENQNKRRDTT